MLCIEMYSISSNDLPTKLVNVPIIFKSNRPIYIIYVQNDKGVLISTPRTIQTHRWSHRKWRRIVSHRCSNRTCYCNSCCLSTMYDVDCEFVCVCRRRVRTSRCTRSAVRSRPSVSSSCPAVRASSSTPSAASLNSSRR